MSSRPCATAASPSSPPIGSSPSCQSRARIPFSPPADTYESLRLLYTSTGNSAVIPMIARLMGHPVEIGNAQTPAGPAPEHPAGVASRRARLRRLPRAPRAGAEVLVRAALGVAPGRRVAVVGLTRMPPIGMLRLARRVGLRTPPRGLRMLPVPPVPAAPPAQPQLREKLALAPEGGGLEDVVGSALPALFPRTLLEGLPEVVRLSEALYGEPCPAVAGNYSVAEVENDFLGRCRAAGHRLGYAQHGGVYLQARVHAQERLELRPDGVYFSWGGRQGTARPTGSPHLERIRDTHAGGDAITVIEGLEPPDPYLLRYGSYPLGNRAFEPAVQLGDVVATVAPAVRDRMVLRRFPNPQAAPRRPAALEALSSRPKLGLTEGGDAIEWMQRSRIALIGYPGTPLLEAVTIGVPFVVLWDPDLWPVRDDGLDAHLALEREKMSFRDPRAAAEHLDAVADDVTAWWTAPATQEARRAFGQRYAVAADWLEGWTAGLRALLQT